MKKLTAAAALAVSLLGFNAATKPTPTLPPPVDRAEKCCDCDKCDCGGTSENVNHGTQNEPAGPQVGDTREKDGWRWELTEIRPNGDKVWRGVERLSQPVPVSTRSGSLPRGQYRGGSEWSYPGDISEHLMGPNHGFTADQLRGLTKAQAERLHSQHHEGGTRSVRTYSQPVYSSNCPGGVCPTQPTRTRRGIFGGLFR